MSHPYALAMSSGRQRYGCRAGNWSIQARVACARTIRGGDDTSAYILRFMSTQPARGRPPAWVTCHHIPGGTTRSSSARTAKAPYWRARMLVRPATLEDRDALWRIIEPVLRAGETYALPRDWG